MTAKRITRLPKKKIPENALFIGARSPYANPFKIQKKPGGFYTIENKKLNWGGLVIYQGRETAQKVATQMYAFFFKKKYKTEEEAKKFVAPLRGTDLCDWCKPDEPCHLDYLIYLANRGEEKNGTKTETN